MDPDENDYISVAAGITAVEQIPIGYRHAFEGVVADALQSVFRKMPDDASRLVAVFFHHDGGPSLFTYHRSPLHVAADLAGSSGGDLSDGEKHRYAAFLTRETDVFGLPKRSDPGRDEGFQIQTAW